LKNTTFKKTRVHFKIIFSAPVSPPSTDWLWSNATHIYIQLSGWDDGGCDVTKWEVDYRPLGSLAWIRADNKAVSNKLVFIFLIYTYNLHFIREGVAEASQIFFRDTHILTKLRSYEEYCKRDRWQAHRRRMAVHLRCKCY
jgi:hypothetical protein